MPPETGQGARGGEQSAAGAAAAAQPQTASGGALKPPRGGAAVLHDHHIVMKKGNPNSVEMQQAIQASKSILERYNIDWLNGTENRTIAPMNNHSTEYVKKVLERLQEAEAEEATRESIIEALRQIGKELQEGTFIAK
jgi:hypothetical protein